VSLSRTLPCPPKTTAGGAGWHARSRLYCSGTEAAGCGSSKTTTTTNRADGDPRDLPLTFSSPYYPLLGRTGRQVRDRGIGWILVPGRWQLETPECRRNRPRTSNESTGWESVCGP